MDEVGVGLLAGLIKTTKEFAEIEGMYIPVTLFVSIVVGIAWVRATKAPWFLRQLKPRRSRKRVAECRYPVEETEPVLPTEVSE